MIDNLEFRAFVFANDRHTRLGHVRKYTGNPYITHPFRVAMTAARYGLPPEAVAAAYLHDVVEDCEVGIDEIVAEFGTAVAALVAELTNTSKRIPGLNRAGRKAVDIARIATVSPTAKILKLFDRIDNLREINTRSDPDFAALYADETRMLLDVLRDAPADLWQLCAGLAKSVWEEPR